MISRLTDGDRRADELKETEKGGGGGGRAEKPILGIDPMQIG